MSAKKEGARLEDFLSPEEIAACKKAQEKALPLLPALYKLPEIIDDIVSLKRGYQKMDSKLKDSLTPSDLAKELGAFEESVEAKFDRLINSNLDTNNSINTLSNNVNLLCQRLDNSVKDYDRLEKMQHEMNGAFKERAQKIESEQTNIRVDMARQSGSLMTAKQFIPTIVSIVSMIGVIYAIFFKATS